MITRCSRCKNQLEKPRVRTVKRAVCRACQDKKARRRHKRNKKERNRILEAKKEDKPTLL